MSSSLACIPHRGMDCVRTWGTPVVGKCCSPSSPHCSYQSLATPRHGRASCGATSHMKIIRSAAPDVAQVNQIPAANNRVQNSSSSISASALDVLLRPHRCHPADDVHQQHDILSPPLHRGRLINNGLIYRQTFVIRSYEVGYDRAAPIDTIINLFQETSLNHVGMMDFVGDGMGRTHAMMQNRLIWIVTRMHIEMMQYPAWGDVVQIDSWVSSSGKNGMRRDFLMRDYSTGLMIGRATSNWAMMNLDTRRLSKMPEEVRAEITPCFLEASVMGEEGKTFNRIPSLDESAPFRATGLEPRMQDLDMNQHVNHVKYIDWMLECLPQSLLMSCELRSVVLEYRRECGKSDTLDSIAQANKTENFEEMLLDVTRDSFDFTHSLCLCDSSLEVLRGRTEWTPKKHGHQHYH